MLSEAKSASDEEEGAKKPKPNKMGLIITILLVVIAGLLFWIIGYMQGKGGIGAIFKEKTATPTTTATTTKTITKTATKTANPYAGWKTYKNADYAITFRYPADWPDATEESNQDTEFLPINFLTVKLSGDRTRKVALSKASDYSDQYKGDIDLLTSVFNKQAEDIKAIALPPPANAAIQANTIPKYIESTNKKWRGIYYFATIGNGYSTYLTAMAVLTDGKGNIAEFTTGEESIKANDYPCLKSGGSCSGNVEAEAQKFWDYVNSIDESSSDEPVIKGFHSDMEQVIKSLDSI